MANAFGLLCRLRFFFVLNREKVSFQNFRCQYLCEHLHVINCAAASVIYLNGSQNDGRWAGHPFMPLELIREKQISAHTNLCVMLGMWEKN